MLESLFSSRVRSRLLTVLFLSAENGMNAHELSQRIAESYSAVWRELAHAVLQSARAWMFTEGFRPRGAESHAVVVEFVRESFKDRHAAEVALFDQMRRKRNRAIYETSGLISTNEAQQVVEFARKWVRIIEGEITGQDRLPILE